MSICVERIPATGPGKSRILSRGHPGQRQQAQRNTHHIVMKNLIYFSLGVLLAWTCHESWQSWQIHGWAVMKWLPTAETVQTEALLALLVVAIPAAGFWIAVYRFELFDYPVSSLVLGLVAYLLKMPIGALLLASIGEWLYPGEGADTWDLVTYTERLEWLIHLAALLAGVCAGLLLVARSRLATSIGTAQD